MYILLNYSLKFFFIKQVYIMEGGSDVRVVGF